MAYPTLVSLENIIDQILHDDRFSISPNGKQHLISLNNCVIRIRAFLEDFPEKASKNLETRIRDVAMRAEDVIEWFMNEQIRHYVFRYIHWPIAQLRRIMFECQLRKVTDAMESIARDVVEMKNTSSIITKDVQQLDSSVVGAASSSQLTDGAAEKMVGLNEDLLEIKYRLCGGSRQLQILPITGMGGIGKTTLARKAYNDPLIMEHFQIRVWITVSQDYSEERILADLINSMKEFFPEWMNKSLAGNSQAQEGSNESVARESGNECMAESSQQGGNGSLAGNSDQEAVPENSQEGNECLAKNNSQDGNESIAKNCQQVSGAENNSQEGDNESIAENNSQEDKENSIEKAVKVYQALYGKRFLIVLDDMWSTKVLDDTKKLFPDDTSGSRILLTTRVGDVESIAPSLKMRLMDEDQSWDLLRQKVLEHQAYIPKEVESIGKEIARSCTGLPLAVVVVAGVLSTVSMSPTSWKEIAGNIKSSLATSGGGRIDEILSLSYNHLPHGLRPCFLYMGGFPEDHEIRASEITKLWIAEGFVKPAAAPKSLEDSAQEYMDDLVKRSLVLVSNTKSNGKIKSCRLHDLVRDLCIKLSQEEKFLVHVKGRRAQKLLKSMQNERRISIFPSDIDSFANISSSAIRTIMYFQYTDLKSFGSFRLLRVLDLLRLKFESGLIPHQFFELFHLRYLAFCYNGQFPSGITNLQNLRTLIFRGGRLKFDYHCRIWNMPQLRHFIFLDHGYKIVGSDSFSSTLPLKNLQTLVRVRNLVCSKRIFDLIPNLKKLSLTYIRGMTSFFFHELVHLRQLEKLKLELEYSEEPFSFEAPKLVLPTSLKKLALIGWGPNLTHLMIDDIGPLPNLEVLKLRKFHFLKQTWIASEGTFPELRFLLIEDSDLKQWECEGSHFPVLEQLILHSCRSLSRLPDDMGEIPTLKLVEVKDYMESLASNIKQIREEQLEYGDDVFQLRCIKLEPVAPSKVEKKKKVVRKTKVSRKRRAEPRGIHIISDMMRRGY